MTASISNFDDARQRREIRRLENAVKGIAAERAAACAEYDRGDYFFARSPEEQRFRHVPLQKSMPLKSWWPDIAAGVFLAIFILCVVVTL